jgi:hypothetical protein
MGKWIRTACVTFIAAAAVSACGGGKSAATSCNDATVALVKLGTTLDLTSSRETLDTEPVVQAAEDFFTTMSKVGPDEQQALAKTWQTYVVNLHTYEKKVNWDQRLPYPSPSPTPPYGQSPAFQSFVAGCKSAADTPSKAALDEYARQVAKASGGSILGELVTSTTIPPSTTVPPPTTTTSPPSTAAVATTTTAPPPSNRVASPRAVTTLGVSPPSGGPLPDGYYSVYVTSVSGTSIHVDPIQWIRYEDVRTLIAAGKLKDGDGTGSCTARRSDDRCIEMSDLYAILNDSTQTWTVDIAPTAVFSLTDLTMLPQWNRSTSLAELAGHTGGHEVFWLSVQAGLATRCEQQYLP